jgi:hypothetical protein
MGQCLPEAAEGQITGDGDGEGGEGAEGDGVVGGEAEGISVIGDVTRTRSESRE